MSLFSFNIPAGTGTASVVTGWWGQNVHGLNPLQQINLPQSHSAESRVPTKMGRQATPTTRIWMAAEQASKWGNPSPTAPTVSCTQQANTSVTSAHIAPITHMNGEENRPSKWTMEDDGGHTVRPRQTNVRLQPPPPGWPEEEKRKRCGHAPDCTVSA